jgi:hypothetical protein
MNNDATICVGVWGLEPMLKDYMKIVYSIQLKAIFTLST